ncbi:ankyrin repeat-containing protein [Colletotrichum incanum]|uniref:Ankyrin repeat-containing protein n=1 Tax=Colletotrichum incanum TaxID=1573173 RepID=A0A167EBP4_COLIC|nr:ankyrin repeat-containing protein [Colletotrichum incanum]
MPHDIWSEVGLSSNSLGLVIAVIVCLVAVAASRWPASSALPAVKTPKPRKSLTFRVDDVPVDHVDNLDRNLRSFAELDADLRDDAASFDRRSLGHKDKAYVCATVVATTHLSGRELCARLFRAGKGYPYSYSCDFDGITPLFEDSNGAAVDIIAVPGLGSHALGSWKSPHSDDVWLRDFLPQDVPNIRVLLYGYDTTLPGSLSKQSIEDLGGILVERIVAFRARDGTTRRPLIFIGHSLGGLLIKEALIRARRRRGDAIADLAEACYALLFFGVPNLGLRNDQLRTLVRGQPNEALMHDLLVDNDSEASTFLKRLADQFSESCKGHYRVMSFFERMLSSTLERGQEGKWRKTGPPSLLVTEKSATATGLVAVADEDNIPLNTDHSGLVKYSSRSQGDYTTVRRRIADCVERAKLDVPGRFAEQSFEHAHSKATQACMRSLAFEEIDGRQHGIDAAAAGTCEWLLRHETLIQWTRQHRGLVWIKGKPGSGKSTLMKYALEKVPPLFATQPLVLSFFFHGRGHELQRSLLGLFRSLLHQLLNLVPGALLDLIDTFDQRSKTIGEAGKDWQWHLPMLQAFFQSSLLKILKRRAVLVFIDALDECGEQPAVQLIEHLKQLLSSLPSTDLQLSVCFSCRHYPIIELDGGGTITLDEENNGDIDVYVQDRLSSDHDSDIQSLLSRRAQGVFMWAHIVVDRILQMKRRGEPPGRIKREIERVPQKLDDLYYDLLQHVEDRAGTIRLVQWICFSTRPLTTDELPWAMTIDPNSPDQTLTDCQQSDNFIAQDNIDKRITSLSCGLAEVAPSDDSRIIQFIHQSVKDFFVERGLLVLDNSRRAAVLLAPAIEYLLCLRCVSYFKMVVSSHTGRFCKEDTVRFPFLTYAVTALVTHIKRSEPVEIYAKDILDSLCWPSSYLVDQWVLAYEVVDTRSWVRPSEESSLVHIVSRYDLQKLLLQIILERTEVNFDLKDNYSRTPLSWAAWGGNEAVVKILLNTGKVDVDSKDIYGQTPLFWAAKNRHEAVVKMLLDTGKVDVDSKDNNGRTPLSWAANKGHEAVVKILLNTVKVDVNLKDNGGQTPLSWAAEYGHEAVVKMLLNTGKVDVDSKDIYGQTPLFWAAKNRHEAVVKMLLNADGVNINSSDNTGWTPLSYAAENGHEAVVKMLLNTDGVNINSSDNAGWTPLSYAARNGHKAVVKMLLDVDGVNINLSDNTGWTPLSYAAKNGHKAVVKMLLDADGVNINLSDITGRTPLFWAAMNRHKAVVKMLLDADGVNINSSDIAGRTLLSWAAINGHKAVVKMLLDADGVNINSSDNTGRTPLSYAAKNGHKAVVKMLLNTDGINVNLSDNAG